MAERPRKPKWAIDRDRAKRQGGAREGSETVWLFGLHAVRDALGNPERRLHRLILTPNARERLGDAVTEAVAAGAVEPEIADPRRFPAPLDPQSVHQGAALETEPLDWGGLEARCRPERGREAPPPVVLLLDRVTDPHNVGAILRSAEVFGARAVIAPRHHSAPETGALAKSASGALERQPYIRVRNLAEAMETLKDMGYRLVGLDGAAETGIGEAVAETEGPLGLVLGAEGPGLRPRTRETCDVLARIPAAAEFASLNVSNAAAVALYAARRDRLSPSSGSA